MPKFYHKGKSTNLSQQEWKSIGMRDKFLPESFSVIKLNLRDREGNALGIHREGFIILKKYLSSINLDLDTLSKDQLLEALEKAKVKMVKYFSPQNLQGLALNPETTDFRPNSDIRTQNGTLLKKEGHLNCVDMYKSGNKMGVYAHPKVDGVAGNLEETVFNAPSDEKVTQAVVGVNHSSLSGGKRVEFAGAFVHTKEKGWTIENYSGHYATSALQFPSFLQNLQDQGFDLTGLTVKTMVAKNPKSVSANPNEGYVKYEDAQAFLKRTAKSHKGMQSQLEGKSVSDEDMTDSAFGKGSFTAKK